MRITVLVAALAALPVSAQTLPKLGIDATPITSEFEYLQVNPTPDYWAFAPFVRPQITSAASSVSAITGAINGLAGLPEAAEEPIPNQRDMLDRVGSPTWHELTAEDGDGVTFDQLATLTTAALEASGLSEHTVRIWQPRDNDLDAMSSMREWLTANEASAEDAILVYFDQGVLTGGEDGPHVAVVGAYDPAAGRVLILEVDQEWHIPYWASDVKLMDAMLRPAPAAHGVLEGEIGGLVHIQSTAAEE